MIDIPCVKDDDPEIRKESQVYTSLYSISQSRRDGRSHQVLFDLVETQSNDFVVAALQAVP